jgi:hypothetical protein
MATSPDSACAERPFEDLELAKKLSMGTYSVYHDERCKFIERRLEKELDRQKGTMVQFHMASTKSTKSTKEDEQQLTCARQEIEDILTVRCGRCNVVISIDPDFDSCFALYCPAFPACPARPCAWCLQDVGPDNGQAHEHVRRCQQAPEPERRYGDALYIRPIERHTAPHVAKYW